MLTKPAYSIKDFASWSIKETSFFVIYAGIVSVLYETFELTFLEVPWTPVALIGTAVAFMIGFQNNSVYDRIWEARKIWGGVVNMSRSWGAKTQNLIANQDSSTNLSKDELHLIHTQLVFRHIAWLTALRFSMRQKRKWEASYVYKFRKSWTNIHVPEYENSLDKELSLYLSEEEQQLVMDKDNKPSTILYLQSKHLKRLKEQKLLWEFSFLNLQNVIEELFTLQGQTERIKNFPYPRQYSSLSFYFVWTFIILLPFGIIPEFSDIGDSIALNYPSAEPYFVWTAIPFCAVASWVFHTMERVGQAGENPFEGSLNDVPISTISRAIEIDLRQQLGEDKSTIPLPFPENSDVQF